MKKKKNLDFEVTRDLFIKRQIIQLKNYLQKTQPCVGFCGVRCRSCSQQVLFNDHEITQPIRCLRYTIVFFEKKNCNQLALLLVNMAQLYKYWDSNGCCKFIDVSIYQITRENSVVVSQTKNNNIQLYFVMIKVKKNSFT